MAQSAQMNDPSKDQKDDLIIQKAHHIKINDGKIAFYHRLIQLSLPPISQNGTLIHQGSSSFSFTC
jgi:hypothetical protein